MSRWLGNRCVDTWVDKWLGGLIDMETDTVGDYIDG